MPRKERKNIIAMAKANPKKYMRCRTQALFACVRTFSFWKLPGGITRKMHGHTTWRQKSVATLSPIPQLMNEYMI